MRADRYAKNTKAIGVAFSSIPRYPCRISYGHRKICATICLFPLDRCCDRGTGDRLVSSGRLSGEWERSFLWRWLFFLPLFVTGGFHMDGFMDTKDALSSYQGKEKKLEILKDPHIGAFAVIHLLSYLLLALGFASVIEGTKAVVAVSAAFFLSRCLSGLSVIHFPGAKKEGSLYCEQIPPVQRSYPSGW